MEIIVRGSASLGRNLTRLRRRYSGLRLLVPLGIARPVLYGLAKAAYLRRCYVPLRGRSRYDNLFHCAVHKTGSQWIRSVLTDVRTFQYAGLLHQVPKRGRAGVPIPERSVAKPFSSRRIVGPLYMTYERFMQVPKAGSWRAFFIMRDPRDLVISYYFSIRYSHVLDKDPAQPLFRAREHLRGLSEEEGLLYSIRYAQEQGLFTSLRSWQHAVEDERVLLFRFEDLSGPYSFATFRQLFAFLDVSMPDEMLSDLLDAYSFRRLSGRSRSEAVPTSHLRGGLPGEWRRRFTSAVHAEFRAVAGDLPELLGYGPSWSEPERHRMLVPHRVNDAPKVDGPQAGGG